MGEIIKNERKGKAILKNGNLFICPNCNKGHLFENEDKNPKMIECTYQPNCDFSITEDDFKKLLEIYEILNSDITLMLNAKILIKGKQYSWEDLKEVITQDLKRRKLKRLIDENDNK